MEEVIDDIMEYIRQKTAGFSYMDQAQIFSDLEGKMADMNADALRDDYITDGLYC